MESLIEWTAHQHPILQEHVALDSYKLVSATVMELMKALLP